MTRKFDADYRVAGTTEILTSENAFREDIDIRLDGLETGQDAIDTAAAEARDRVVKYADDVIAPKAAALQTLLDTAVAETNGIRAAAVADVRAGVEARGDTLAKLLALLDSMGAADAAFVAGMTASLAACAPLASPALTGTPTAPTAMAGTATAQIATTSFVAAAIAALVNSSPTALDTLKELADALGDDANFAATVTTALAARLRVDAAQVLTEAQAIQGRANLGVAGKAGVRNRLLNAASQICQDRATGETVVISSSGYVHDGVRMIAVGGGALACSQQAIATPGGSPYRTRAVVSTADATLAAGDLYAWEWPIEGTDVADFGFGTAAAKNFCWRRGVRLPAGTYGIAIGNNDWSRSYVHGSVTVDSSTAGTDIIISGVTPGDTGGTWLKDTSGAGLRMRLTLAAGSSYQTDVTGAWQAAGYCATPAQSNLMTAIGAVVDVFDGGLYPGVELPAWEMPEFGADLRACSWLWQPVGEGWTGVEENDTQFSLTTSFAPMRTAPALSLLSTSISTRLMTGAPGVDRTQTSCVISVATVSPRGAWVLITCPGGNVAGRMIQGRDAASIIIANARL